MKTTYFTPGPSELYPTVGQHMAAAIDQQIGSISHRSKQFEELYKHAEQGLRQLLGLPENYHLFFLSSATEIWERMLQNCVVGKSFHLVNGSFSRRFFEIAQELGKKPELHLVPFGKGFNIDHVKVPAHTEAICAIHNETSSGATMPTEDIYSLGKQQPEALLLVDAVSSLPNPDFNYSRLDSVYWSVQKCFGLPAGLAVWVLSERCMQRAKVLQQEGLSIGSYHSLPALEEKANNHQTPETPNVLGIYLLGKVVQDMNRKGISTIRQETETKARMLYQYLEESAVLSPAVAEPAHRSPTTIVANTTLPASELKKRLEPHGFVIGSGYGSNKDSQIRIANFPAHSVEQMEQLVKVLREVVG